MTDCGKILESLIKEMIAWSQTQNCGSKIALSMDFVGRNYKQNKLRNVQPVEHHQPVHVAVLF
jgi:hypothetical protein